MTETKSGGLGIGMFTIVAAILAYFVYGHSISAALGMVLLVIGSGFTTILSLIPFVGVFISYYINITYTYPIIMGFTGLTTTWLITAVLVIHTILGIIFTFVTSMAVLTVMTRR